MKKKFKAPKLEYETTPSQETESQKLRAMLAHAAMWIAEQHPNLTDEEIKAIFKGQGRAPSSIITLN